MEPVYVSMVLDVGRPGVQSIGRVKQQETGSRMLRLYLRHDGAPVALEGTERAVLRAIRPDGVLLYEDCAIEGSTISRLLSPQILAAAGKVRCELSVYGENQVLYSPCFELVVERSPLYADALVVQDEGFSALTLAMSEMNALAAQWGHPTAEAQTGAQSAAQTLLEPEGVRFLFTLEKGDKGERGEKGEKGDKGDKGDTGGTGARGEKGDKGDTGESGPQGEKGEKGDTGHGLRVLGYYETVEALFAAVRDPGAGDAYGVGIEAPYAVWIYDGVNAAWVDNGSLRGERGEKGEKGDRGETGPQGETGLQGETGPQGEAGPQGEKGEKGDTGEAGPKLLDATTTTTLRGLLKGGDGAVGTAVAGTDYALPPVLVQLSLGAEGWTGEGPFMQALAIEGVTAGSRIDLQPEAAAIAQLIADGVQGLYIENADGVCTACAVGAAPTAALTLQASITEVM